MRFNREIFHRITHGLKRSLSYEIFQVMFFLIFTHTAAVFYCILIISLKILRKASPREEHTDINYSSELKSL